MGKRVKKVQSAKLEIYTSSKEDRRKRKSPIEAACSDDEANEDLSLKIVQKSIQGAASNASKDVPEIVVTLKEEKSKKEKKKRKKSKEIEITGDSVDNRKDKEEPEADNAAELSNKAAEISIEAVEANPVSVSDNVVLRKLLRGPRYFDPPDNNSWGACYNCGEEGHTTVNCTSAKRKKPCFVCGSFEHNAKQCSKAHDCFICKQQGHRARDCPDRYNSSKMCLKCGDLGHDMFSCSNDYCPDDLKEIQCYICGRFGHLCCKNYEDPGPRDVTCYRCGLSGHTGLACLGSRGDKNGAYASSCYQCGLVGHFARECTSSMNACLGSRGDTNGIAHGSSCYKCGLIGHFARECTTSSMKAGKRYREPSTPKQRNSKKNRDRLEVKSAPHDYGKSQKKKKSRHSAFTSASKTKHKSGWIIEDHGDYYGYSQGKANNWRSPSTPSNRRSKFSTTNSNYVLGSCSSKNPHKINFNDSPSYVSARYYQHGYPESRFGNNSNGSSGMGRIYNRW